MVKVEKILFPCDFTENSSKILPYVLSMAEKYKSQVYIIYVNELHKWGGHFIPHPSVDKLQKESLEAAQKAMDRMCEDHLQSCPNFQRRIVAGDAPTEILKTIQSEGIDMVIMGTHGRKGLEHALFGSVAENVVKKSPVPVLIVNPYTAKGAE
jgi:nucleotide-binding universal stress UspA family protein